MALDIVIDARRVRDFGIGTYIRSLVHALSAHRYARTATPWSPVPARRARWRGLPDNFRIAVYARRRSRVSDHLLFPLFLRRLKPDLVHIPLNRVPLLMIRPYVVTIHDMVNLFYDEKRLSALHMHLRRFRFRRGLTRASRVIAVSDATRRDVENLLGVPPGRITPRLQRARSGLSGARPGRRRGRAPPHHGALPDRPSVSALRGQHPPPQEHPAAGGSVRGAARATGGAPGLWRPAAGDHRRHHLAVPGRAPGRAQKQDGARRALSGFRAVRHAALFLRSRRRRSSSPRATKVSDCRRSKPWPAAPRWSPPM